jgi:hypothetical protein
MSDEELVFAMTQTMRQASSTRMESCKVELQAYYDEAVGRGKAHLWNRARDCYRA